MLNNIILVVTIDKFDPNPVLININKLKPNRFIEDKILQLVLVKPSDLVIDEPVQIEEHAPLPTELKDFQLVEFELVNNHLTHGTIKRIDVHVHYYHDVHVEDNNVTICNDQNDAFSGTFIDVNVLKVCNLKDVSIHSHMVVTN